MPLGKKNGIVVQTCFSIFLQSKLNATKDILLQDEKQLPFRLTFYDLRYHEEFANKGIDFEKL